MKKILFRADDLGYSEGINYGIEKSVKEGLIGSVGVMLNMDATAHGVSLLKNENIAFGQHTNICVGRPLTDPSLIPSLVDEAGFFKSSKTYRTAEKDFVVVEEALLEIKNQYNRFIELFGRKPDYFEGHAIASDNFFVALKQFSIQEGLTYSGLPENTNPNAIEKGSFIYINQTKSYLIMESMKPDYDPYQTLKNLSNQLHEDGVNIFVCHPGYLDAYILKHSSLLIPRTQEVEMLIDPKVKQELAEKEIELIDYRYF